MDGRRARAELQQLSLLGASSVAADASSHPAPLKGENFLLPLAGQEELVPLGLRRGAKLECGGKGRDTGKYLMGAFAIGCFRTLSAKPLS